MYLNSLPLRVEVVQPRNVQQMSIVQDRARIAEGGSKFVGLTALFVRHLLQYCNEAPLLSRIESTRNGDQLGVRNFRPLDQYSRVNSRRPNPIAITHH